jgi:hypothetical protein
LEAAINKKIASVLKNEIAKEVVETMQEHVQTDVYDAYDPVYPEKRRMYNGGLIDPDSIEIQVVDDNTISVENIAYDGDKNVPLIVESGIGYTYAYHGGARPFTEKTREELASTDRLKNAMKKGLKNRGLDVI